MSSVDDAAVLQLIGHDLVQGFAAVTVETFLIAIYSILAMTATLMLLRKQHTRVSICTCVAVVALYIMALSLWIIDVRNIIAEVQMTLLSNSSDTYDDLYAAASSSILGLASVEDVLYAFMTNVGDTIIIWRVYAFWSSPKERLVLLIPLVFLLGSMATSATLSYCANKLGPDIVLGTFQNPAFCRNIQTASYSTTVATTAVATLLISYKTWAYRRNHLAAFGNANPRTRTMKVMFGLIESGIIYVVFFIVQVVVSLDSVNEKIRANAGSAFAFTIYEYISSLIVGIYPTIIVILVHSSYSVLDSHAASSGTRVLVSRSFACRGTNDGQITSAAALSDSGRIHKTELNLYEMSRRTVNDEDDKDGRMKVPPPAIAYNM